MLVRMPSQHVPSIPDRSDFEPGQFVSHPGRPEWGMGQVQSAIGTRVTVTFEHAGKQLVNAAVVGLVPLDPSRP
jgi:hypothetical protein